jgi:hypothetical protein
MDITLSIETTDQRIVRALMNGRNLTNRQPTPIADGVDIVHVTGDAFGITKNQFWKFVITGVTGITVNVVSNYISDRLKDQPDPPAITINNTGVQINAGSINTAINQAMSSADKPSISSDRPARHKTHKRAHVTTKTPRTTTAKPKKGD